MFNFDTKLTYQAVIYADGGSIPNPGFAGFGLHGYFFTDLKSSPNAVPKKPVAIANHFMEYFNKTPNGVDYATSTDCGYIAYKPGTELKKGYKAVTPIGYVDAAISFFDPQTNNVAELSALQKAFEIIIEVQTLEMKLSKVKFFLDSQYVLNTVTKFGDAYRKNGWKTSLGEPAKNADLIENILLLRDKIKESGIELVYEWVKGHQGDLGNGMADYQASIAVRRARAMDNPNIVHWSLHKGYWDADVERHPFMTFPRGYFNRVQTFNKPGEYFIIQPAGEELTIGKRDHEAYAVIKLNNPCNYLEAVREAQSKFGQDENRVMLDRMERVYNRFIQKFIRWHGHFCLLPSANERAVNFLDKATVAHEHNPPALIYRVIQAFGELELRLCEFRKRTGGEEPNLTENEKYHDIIAHDITSEFYTVGEKQKGKEVVQEMTLRPEFVVGYKNHILQLEETRDGITKKHKFPMALGMDVPDRNALKRLEDHKPQVFLVTWKASPDVLQYAFVIDCVTGTGIWSNYFCDRIFVQP